MRGTEIHRRIELDQRGQVPFDELSPELYDVAPGESGDGPGGFRAYQESRFASRRAELVETPFTVELDTGHRVRGRIDAVYCDGSHWEIVDFKSGRPSEDPSRLVQLQAYAVAATEVELGVPAPTELDVTFAYLGGGLTEETHHADPAWVEEARASIATLAMGIDDQAFDPSPGSWCGHCDFLQFCPAGQAQLNR